MGTMPECQVSSAPWRDSARICASENPGSATEPGMTSATATTNGILFPARLVNTFSNPREISLKTLRIARRMVGEVTGICAVLQTLLPAERRPPLARNAPNRLYGARVTHLQESNPCHAAPTGHA